MKFRIVVCALLLNGAFQPSRADEAPPSVELQERDKQVTLSVAAQQKLRQQALKLVQTSNFHSSPDDEHHIFTVPHQIQREYRKTVAGRFLLITFPTPQKIRTTGGEITVTEIIVGLNRDDYASGLFTIDASGAIVGHAKYDGGACIEILKTVKEFDHDA
jgi:hypothetical protein